MRVLITSPSFVSSDNVSGISTLTALIVKHCDADFVPFTAGRRDGQSIGLGWMARQATLPLRFLKTIKAAKPDVIHINTALETRAVWRDLVLTLCASLRKRPIVLHIHGGRFMMSDLRPKLQDAAIRKMLLLATETIVLGNAEKKFLVENYPAGIITVLPNATELGEMPRRVDQKRVRTLLFLGRLDRAKGLDEIVEAAMTLKTQGFDFKFKCFGTGPDQEKFFEGMRSAIGEDFYYGGVASAEQRREAYATSDIFILPSHFEGMPMALLEAMAAGCVPVVSNVGSMPDAVSDGRNGYLVEPRNITALVGKLKFLLSGENSWSTLREKARWVVERKFDIRDHASKLRTLYTHAIDRASIKK
jgi:glycosyltransferase involved in cell wall biosynthesis